MVILANWLLGVPDEMIYMTTAASVFVLLGVVSIIMGYGTANPEVKFENIAKLALGFHGITCVILASTYTFAALALLFWPIFMVVSIIHRQIQFSDTQFAAAAVCVIAFVVLSIWVIIRPLQWGIKLLHRREF